MPFPFDVKEMWNKAFRQSGTNTKIAVTSEDTSLNLIFDQSPAPIYYLGEAARGSLTSDPVWRISKIDTSSGVVIQLASESFDQIWNDRASLTYV